jgi:hypothetical protein
MNFDRIIALFWAHIILHYPGSCFTIKHWEWSDTLSEYFMCFSVVKHLFLSCSFSPVKVNLGTSLQEVSMLLVPSHSLRQHSQVHRVGEPKGNFLAGCRLVQIRSQYLPRKWSQIACLDNDNETMKKKLRPFCMVTNQMDKVVFLNQKKTELLLHILNWLWEVTEKKSKWKRRYLTKFVVL